MDMNFRFDWERVVIIIAAAIIVLTVMCGCKAQKEYVEVVKTDTCYISKVQYDSIAVLDSVRIYEKGCTVLVEKYRDQYKYKTIVDTLTLTKTLTETKVETKVEEVNVMYWWQKGLMWAGVIALIGLVVWVIRNVKGR